MAEVIEIRNKTDQRVQVVLDILRDSKKPISYDDLRVATGGIRNPKTGLIVGGTSYDVLLYILSTLDALGYVEKSSVSDGPGRPRVFFRWIGSRGGARAMGVR